MVSGQTKKPGDTLELCVSDMPGTERRPAWLGSRRERAVAHEFRSHSRSKNHLASDDSAATLGAKVAEGAWPTTDPHRRGKDSSFCVGRAGKPLGGLNREERVKKTFL